MKNYPEVTFHAPKYNEEVPEETDGWFAGEGLAKAIAQRLKEKEEIEITFRDNALAEDWGWCIPLKSKGISFFLGVGQNWDTDDNEWKIFVAKDFDLIARIFKKRLLKEAIGHLQKSVDDCLEETESTTEVKWTYS